MPFGWAYAFYQNLTALGNGESEDFKSLISRSWQQARLWPAQNHLVISILFVFGIFVFLNIVSAMVILPELFRILTGVETQFTQSIGNVLNTTFFATAFWLTYLCVDPIAKAVYVLRCFYGESLRSGEDLKAELRNFPATGGLPKKIATSLVILSALALQASAASKDPGQPLTSNAQLRRTSVAAAELDRDYAGWLQGIQPFFLRRRNDLAIHDHARRATPCSSSPRSATRCHRSSTRSARRGEQARRSGCGSRRR
jgi:hypothetical protein